jgi:AraC-like DNA-binding protein
MHKIREKVILTILISALSLHANAEMLNNKTSTPDPFFWISLSYIFSLTVIIFLIVIIFINWRKKNKLNERMLHFTQVVYDLLKPLALIKNPLDEIVKDENLNEVQRNKLNVAIWSANSLQSSISLLIEEEKTDNIFQYFIESSVKKQINSNKSQKDISDISNSETLPYKETLAEQLFMEKIMAILKTNLENTNFTIDTLCMKIGMSRSSLYNRIKNISGMAPNDFIRLYRLSYAKDLLSSHQYTISEVAYKAGFSDAKYFSAVFKKQYRTTPSAFSKL